MLDTHLSVDFRDAEVVPVLRQELVPPRPCPHLAKTKAGNVRSRRGYNKQKSRLPIPADHMPAHCQSLLYGPLLCFPRRLGDTSTSIVLCLLLLSVPHVQHGDTATFAGLLGYTSRTLRFIVRAFGISRGARRGPWARLRHGTPYTLHISLVDPLKQSYTAVSYGGCATGAAKQCIPSGLRFHPYCLGSMPAASHKQRTSDHMVLCNTGAAVQQSSDGFGIVAVTVAQLRYTATVSLTLLLRVPRQS